MTEKEESRESSDSAPFAALAFKISNDPFVGNQSLSNWVKDVTVFFLERDQIVLRDHHADLFHVDGWLTSRIILVQSNHSYDDQQLVVVRFAFGALWNIDDVFKQQWVQIEQCPELAHDRPVSKALDIDPCYFFAVEDIIQFFDCVDGYGPVFRFGVLNR